MRAELDRRMRRRLKRFSSEREGGTGRKGERESDESVHTHITQKQ